MEKGETALVVLAMCAVVAILAIVYALPKTGETSVPVVAYAAGGEPGAIPHVQILLDDKIVDEGETLSIATETQITLSSPVKQSNAIKRVDFSAEHVDTGCTVYLGSDRLLPFSIVWFPYDTAKVCGYGKYALTTTALHASDKAYASIAVINLRPAESEAPTVFIHEPPQNMELAISARDGEEIYPVYVEARGDVSKIELYADSVYIHDGMRSQVLTDTRLGSDVSGEPYEYELYWNMVADAQAGTGDYQPFGSRQVTVVAYNSQGKTASASATVHISELVS